MDAITQINVSTNPLFLDVVETYGESLQRMGLRDQSWLLRELSWEYWKHCKTNIEFPSDAAEELMSRVKELSVEELGVLIQAVVNKE
jgi:hypothetical protein